MKFLNVEVELLLKAVRIEAKKNPSPDIDVLLEKLENAASFRTENYPPGKHRHSYGDKKGEGKSSLATELDKARRAKAKREQQRPVLGDVNYHPLLRDQ